MPSRRAASSTWSSRVWHGHQQHRGEHEEGKDVTVIRSKRWSCERAKWGRSLGLAAGATLFLGVVGPPLTAQEPEEEERHAEATVAEHEEHEFHRHHLSVFLGATTADVELGGEGGEAGTESEGGETSGETKTQTDGSIGLDYEYRLNRAWGLVVGFEWVGGDTRQWMAGLGAMLHPVTGLKLLAGPGVERHEGEEEFLFRLGAMYDFGLGSWSLTPAINVDFLDGEQAYVYGIYFGKGF